MDKQVEFLVKLRDASLMLADAANEYLETFAPSGTKENKPAAASPLPGTDSSKLPRKSYKTKQQAEPNEAAWIFSNTEGAESLLATLKSKDGKATIDVFDYQLQGKDHQFIARKPVK